MKIKQTILAISLLIGLGSSFVSMPVYAVDCGGKTLEAGQSCCAGVPTSILTCDGDDEPTDDPTKTGIWSLLTLVLNILTAGIVIAALGGIVYGSILYTAAGGNLDQVKKARVIIANTVLGLVVYALMFSFMNYLIPGGLFS